MDHLQEPESDTDSTTFVQAQPTSTGVNIVLIGFMGTGKSCVGRHLARIGSRHFVDTDDLISQKAGCTIPRIFEQEGEQGFREHETEALRSLTRKRGHVIATGGGIVTQPRNLPILAELGFVVWLRAEEDVIFERVSRNANRPLLQTENPRQTMQDMLRDRRPLYENAGQFVVDTSWLPPADLAHAILNEMHRRGMAL